MKIALSITDERAKILMINDFWVPPTPPHPLPPTHLHHPDPHYKMSKNTSCMFYFIYPKYSTAWENSADPELTCRSGLIGFCTILHSPNCFPISQQVLDTLAALIFKLKCARSRAFSFPEFGSSGYRFEPRWRRNSTHDCLAHISLSPYKRNVPERDFMLKIIILLK